MMPPDVLAGARRAHLLGVGGIGVSALAELLVARGLAVTGSDRADGPTLGRLRRLGVDARAGEFPELAAEADLLVFTSAAPEGHPERVAARGAGVPEFRRGAALAALVAGTRGVGIAGAHGKTTTTTILSRLLEEVGEDPTAAVGGVVHRWGSPARVGAGPWFVAEADESDRSFLALPLDYAVALNVDGDHMENYADLAEIVACFARYLGAARTAAVVHVDDPRLAELAADLDPARCVRVGTGEGADLRYAVGRGDGVLEVAVEFRGEDLGVFPLPRPGLHDGGNAACALAVALHAGLDPDRLRGGLAAFDGVDRRFTPRGEFDGIRVVDDYAHMPAEVAATLAAARASAPDRRVVAVFQPHLYSRTAAHAAGFGAALEAADRAFVLPIYGAREEPVPGVTSGLLAAGRERVRVVEARDLWEAGKALAGEVAPGDLVLTMGAGSVTRLGPCLLGARRRAVLARELPGVVADFGIDESLDRHSFFGIGGPALVRAVPADEAELVGLARYLAARGIEFKVLSAGSNVLISDEGYEGCVIHLGKGFKALDIEDDGVTFTAGAALSMGVLFKRLADAGIGGFECCHHIPGLVGGAVVNNSGAYGIEMLDRVVAVRLLDETGEVREVPKAELDVAYRHTALKGRTGVAVLAARFRGEARAREEILAAAQEQAERRNRTQPAGRGSAGCAFKNPPGEKSAGRLIDAAGLKGTRWGGAAVSEVHGNFLQNVGGATALDVLTLVAVVRRRVREAYGVELEPEVELLGSFPSLEELEARADAPAPGREEAA